LFFLTLLANSFQHAAANGNLFSAPVLHFKKSVTNELIDPGTEKKILIVDDKD
jgi:hypothetical protein